jgi:hypothetical protein
MNFRAPVIEELLSVINVVAVDRVAVAHVVGTKASLTKESEDTEAAVERRSSGDVAPPVDPDLALLSGASSAALAAEASPAGAAVTAWICVIVVGEI